MPSAGSSSDGSPSSPDRSLGKNGWMLDRIHSFRRAIEDGAAERRVALPFGTGLFCDSLPDVYDLNFVRVERAASATAIEAAVDAEMETFFHRKLTLDRGRPATGAALATEGWEATTHLVMAQQREPDRRVATDAVREVRFAEIEPLRTALISAESWGSASLASDLNRGVQRVAQAVPVRYFGAFADGRAVGYCELRETGGVAQIEDVNTLPAVRGRGLGRALVQCVADEARLTNEIVFLEALAEDWPRLLYEKLGFDVIGSRQLLLRRPHPLTRLRLRTPRLDLRLATVAELRLLACVARGGIHPPDEMPFEVPWTDRADEPEFEDGFVAFHNSALAEWRPERWVLNLVVFAGGTPVGSQSLEAARFGETRAVRTGSWLGQAQQGIGLGTEMRAAVLQLAFGTLGASLARSGAILGNAQSLRVSEKLGYAKVGTSSVSPRGTPVIHHDLELTNSAFRSPVAVEVEGAEHLLGLFGA
jgi:RimJ/RimL family protein N-acetyltransferase/ribosomal protein S18 acetylase RimI-like enzyme